MLDEFKQYLLGMGKSENTALNYCDKVKLYFKWCLDSFGSEPQQLYRANMLDYISYMKTLKRYNPKSVNNHLSSLRSFNEFLIASGRQTELAIVKNDFMKVQVAYANPCTVEQKDVEAFRQRLLEGGNKRDFAIVTLYTYTGIRRSECVNLRLDQVDLICHLNQIDGIASAAPLYLDPAKHYTKDWDNKQVADYLGLDFSNLGSAYKYVGNANHTVTYNNSGSLVRDLVCFNYKYNDIEFTMAASKLGVPYDCIYSLSENKTTSVKAKNGMADVLFAASAGENEKQPEIQKLMVADFQYNGVCYRVTAENISATEFYNIVNSILNK